MRILIVLALVLLPCSALAEWDNPAQGTVWGHAEDTFYLGSLAYDVPITGIWARQPQRDFAGFDATEVRLLGTDPIWPGGMFVCLNDGTAHVYLNGSWGPAIAWPGTPLDSPVMCSGRMLWTGTGDAYQLTEAAIWRDEPRDIPAALTMAQVRQMEFVSPTETAIILEDGGLWWRNSSSWWPVDQLQPDAVPTRATDREEWAFGADLSAWQMGTSGWQRRPEFHDAPEMTDFFVHGSILVDKSNTDTWLFDEHAGWIRAGGFSVSAGQGMTSESWGRVKAAYR